MSEILLHSKTRQSLERLIQGGTHAILLTGDLGAGKFTIATYLVDQIVGSDSPYVLTVESAGKAIGIEQVRELQKFLQLKTTGSNAIRRAVIIEAADTMTAEAQNALLKVLEEPPEDTIILLTASKPHQLRPTIHSRVQSVMVMPPAKSEVTTFFKEKGFSESEINKAYMLSNGQIGLLTALLQDKADNKLVTQIDIAKQLYGMSAFERLAKVDELSKDRETLSDLLFACKRICTTALEQAALKNQVKTVESWHKQLSLILSAEESLKYTPNTKLLLTDLFISI